MVKSELSSKPVILDFVPLNSYTTGQPVKLVIKAATDLGYKAIVDNKYWGVIYYDEVFQELEPNQHIDGFIKKIREDGKLDLSLYKMGNFGTREIADKIIFELTAAGGSLAINDKTNSEKVYELFGVSKKKFKMALGDLYKKRIISIDSNGITLLTTPTQS